MPSPYFTFSSKGRTYQSRSPSTAVTVSQPRKVIPNSAPAGGRDLLRFPAASTGTMDSTVPSTATSSSLTTRRSLQGTRELHARVDRAVQQVDPQVDGHDRDDEQRDDALDGEEVAAQHGHEQQAAHAVEVEEDLGDDRA